MSDIFFIYKSTSECLQNNIATVVNQKIDCKIFITITKYLVIHDYWVTGYKYFHYEL